MNILQISTLMMTILLGLFVIISNQLNYSNDLVFFVLFIITIGLFSIHIWKKKQHR
ncbi:hypothetical protein [Alkalihalobacterium elongatum]|uniref:hypothetical protein n=1 Tax=Alkalihalobacterium elongatum TaxID=2675466 RepID=UPI001C1FC4C0|nr:hypothetical protein [Alkalihalobacterium elongatum]